MSAPLVSTLRARPDVVRLAGSGPGDEAIAVRVQIPEVWDAVRIEAAPTASVLEVKRRALAELVSGHPQAEAFVVKFRGNEVLDERVTLTDAGVRSGSTRLPAC